MKKAIKLLCAIFIFTALFSCAQDDSDFTLSKESNSINDLTNVKIFDTFENTNIEITTEYIKKKWEREIKENDNNIVELDKFTIIKSFDIQTNTDVYFLKSISKDRSLETGAFLIKNSDNTYKIGTKFCSCVGCPTGCSLIIEGSSCKCSGCSGSNKSCTKTEQQSIP